MMETFLVSDDLDSNRLSSGMIAALEDLAERALAQYIDDLVPVREMIASDDNVIATFVIIAVVA